MTTRIDPQGPAPGVTAGPTAARSTALPTRPFQQVMRAGANAIMASAESAVTRLPGGPILAAAFRPGPTLAPGYSPEGAALAPTGPGLAGGAPEAGGIEGVLAQNADQNLYFLSLQERISQENRMFTTVSNVLKARHETVKNAIGNIR